MSQTITKEVIKQQVLTLLISRYENSPAGSSVFVTIPDTPWADIYYGGKAHALRERIHVSLRELDAAGLTNVLWAWINDEFQVSKVYLNLKKLELAYDESGVMRRNKEMSTLSNILEPLADHPWPWVQEWHKRAQNTLAQGKTPGLPIDDANTYTSLVTALQGLISVNSPLTTSQFSQRVFGDETHFAQHVCPALVKMMQEALGEPYRTENDLLDSLNLITRPELVLFAGHLHFAVNNVAYNLCLFPHGLGLPLAGIEALEITHLAAKRIITVDNLDTYYSLAERVNSAREMVIYTNGHPRCATRILLSKLATYIMSNNCEPDLYHYGSISYDGIRTFEHLRKSYFPGLQPYGMDTDAYEAQTTFSQPMCETEAIKLDYLMQDYSYNNWQPLLATMLQKRLVAKSTCS